ncbi:MAG: DNA/RNA non-specific endonuclease [Pseudomonadota bacterium]
MLQAIRDVAVGQNNLDMTPDEFLTHVRQDQQQYFLERLKEYEAMLHTIGLLAGVVGTEAEQTALRDAVTQAIQDYINGLSFRDPMSPDHPGAFVSPGAAVIANVQDYFGFDDAADRTRRASEVQNAHELEFNLRIGEMLADLASSIWEGLVQWWNDFWQTYETEGLIIAMNRARIDATFLAAEVAIDIAISVALAGFGAAAAAALKGLRFVGMRTSRATTRVIIKAIPDGTPNPRATTLVQREVLDSDIDPSIDRIVDEDRFGGAGPLDDTEQRATPNGPTPSTTYVRGRNSASIVVDPDTGRPASGSATIRDDFGSSDRGDNATEIGREFGRDGDHGGHIFAHRFFGDVPDQGIVPQAANLNTGAWKTMENEWADWIAYGRANNRQIEIEVNVEIDPPGAVRPDHFYGDYTVYEVAPDGTRTPLRSQPIDMANEPGETFDRVYFRTDPDGSMHQR